MVEGRICAVWGGGQILGRPLGPLNPSASRGIPVPASQPPFRTNDNPPPPPSSTSSSSSSTALGIPVLLSDEPDAEPTTFTADWVVCSPYLFGTLFPSHPPPEGLAKEAPRSVRMIAILSRAVPFPRPPTSSDLAASEEGDDLPDSQLFVFPPGSVASLGEERGAGVELGTVTALQTGKGTMSCPEGYRAFSPLSFSFLIPSRIGVDVSMRRAQTSSPSRRHCFRLSSRLRRPPRLSCDRTSTPSSPSLRSLLLRPPPSTTRRTRRSKRRTGSRSTPSLTSPLRFPLPPPPPLPQHRQHKSYRQTSSSRPLSPLPLPLC